MLPNNGVPAEARGKVRRFKIKLANSAAVVDNILETSAFRRAVEGLIFRGSETGRQRALKAVRRLAPPLKLEAISRGLAIWSYLNPRDSVIAKPTDPGQTQNSVTMNYVVARVDPDRKGMRLGSGLWTIEVPDHALGRLEQRSPNVDFSKSLYQAHYAVLSAKVPIPIPTKFRTLYVPAADGVFFGQLISGKDISGNVDNGLVFYFRARTWLHEDQLYDNQSAIKPGSPSYGETVLLPYPLRTVERIEDQIKVTSTVKLEIVL